MKEYLIVVFPAVILIPPFISWYDLLMRPYLIYIILLLLSRCNSVYSHFHENFSEVPPSVSYYSLMGFLTLYSIKSCFKMILSSSFSSSAAASSLFLKSKASHISLQLARGWLSRKDSSFNGVVVNRWRISFPEILTSA